MDSETRDKIIKWKDERFGEDNTFNTQLLFDFYEEFAEGERKVGIQAVIDYLKNEILTQSERTAGEPRLTAHLNAVEKTVLRQVINALEEGVKYG